MAEFYQILGLDAPPKDRREVKKAYSKKLKITRPEDDPDGFMRLRGAHDYALEWLSWQNTEPQIIIDSDGPDPEDRKSVAVEGTNDEIGDEAARANTVKIEDLSPTAYSLGASPSLDAPPQIQIEPPSPPLDAAIIALLENEESRNNRESWNNLFRKTRALDIDNYVDFENLLLHRILEIHGFYIQKTADSEPPENMPRLLNASIVESLFKTMHWDEITHLNPEKEHRIVWLERRMGLRKTSLSQFIQESKTQENVPRKIARWFWPFLGGAIALTFLFEFLSR